MQAGTAPTPLQVGGKVFLSGPYDGDPLSLAAITPATAGPFDLGTVVVRVAFRVDPETAQVTAVPDRPRCPGGQLQADHPGRSKGLLVNSKDLCAKKYFSRFAFEGRDGVQPVKKRSRLQVAACRKSRKRSWSLTRVFSLSTGMGSESYR